MHKKQLNNKRSKLINDKGFTLIELIVASAVGVVVMLIVMTFLTLSLREFKITGIRNSLQQESQIAQSQVGNLINEAVNITKNASEAGYESYIIETGKEKIKLVYDLKEKRLLIGTVGGPTEPTSEDLASVPGKNLMASNVSGFVLNPKNINCSQEDAIVQVNLDITIDGKTLTTSNEYALRNGDW